MREKLTVIIPCKDERMNIRPCVESVRAIADEILVADSGSTDGTLDIIRELGCRLVEREYVDSGNFKNWAIPQATHPWVLIVDADERVTPELANEIQQVLSGPIADGYLIFRRNFCFGRELKHGGWNTDSVLRLFRRDIGRYDDNGDHAEVQIPSGQIGKLRARFDHFTYWSLEQYMRKAERYSTQTAEIRFGRGRRASMFDIAARGSFRFLHLYVLRLGFLDGVPGLIMCGLSAFGSFNKMAKLWVMHEGLPQPDPEAEYAADRAAGFRQNSRSAA